MNVAEYTHARLVETIDTMTPTEFSKAPGRYFTRNRKVDFKKAVLLSITASKGTIFEDIRKFYTVTECQPNMAPSPSALTQQLGKLSSQAFPEVLRRFNNQFEHKTFHGFQLLACDGTGLAFNSEWNYDCYVRGPHAFFGVHLVALYDLMSRKYVDAEIQPARLKNEFSAICQLCKRQKNDGIKRLLIADRGFPSYNFYANAVHAGTSYLVRLSEATAKSVVGGSQRLDELGGDFDISLILHLVRHKRKRQYLHQNDLSNYRYIAPDTQFDFLDPSKEGEIDIAIRIVCVKLPDGSCEYLATNLDKSTLPTNILKDIYVLRWGIETSFRFLKLTLGAEFFHARKRERIVQEIWSRMILYNFCMEIANHAETERKAKAQQTNCKYVYTLNISESLKACRDYLLLSKCVQRQTDLVGWILKAAYCPIRKGRNFKRKPVSRGARSFNYR